MSTLNTVYKSGSKARDEPHFLWCDSFGVSVAFGARSAFWNVRWPVGRAGVAQGNRDGPDTGRVCRHAVVSRWPSCAWLTALTSGWAWPCSFSAWGVTRNSTGLLVVVCTEYSIQYGRREQTG
jgi:hypothetical protein